MGVFEEIVIWVLICGLLSLILAKRLSRKKRFPPGPFALPLIGHLHLLHNLPHRCLAKLSKKYGPFMGIRLGQRRVVVVISSPELAKEVLATHDKVFANRPPFDFISVMLYGLTNDVVFSAHGPQWRKRRKLCFVSLFTPKRLQELQGLREEEIAAFLIRLHQAAAASSGGGGGAPIDVGRYVSQLPSRIVTRLVLSEASDSLGLENLADLVKEFEHEASIPTLGDLVPCLSFLDFRRKHQMRLLHDRYDKAISALIANYKQSSARHDDLLQALFSRETGYDPSIPPQETFTREEIKAICHNILLAGVHTTSSTIEWAMAELLRNPHCFQRLQNEIDTRLGKKKQIIDANIPTLHYLKCIVKEVLRLHPVLPMLLPHISSEECTVNGYMLPADTIISVNVWAIQRDETLWTHANEFMPERFEGKDIDVKGQNFELLPFGSGRRVCLGMPIALSVVEVTIANLVNSFDWELPLGETHTSINMAETNGLASSKATPLMAIPKARI